MNNFRDLMYAVKESGLIASLFLAARYILKINYQKSLTLREMRKGLAWEITSETLEKNRLYREKNIHRRKRPQKIDWLLPPIAAGSGGHRTAARMISHLIGRGYKITIWIVNPVKSQPADLSADMARIFGIKGCNVLPLISPEYIETDVLIATDRWTVFPAAKAEKVLKKYYFIQDYEPLFYESGSASVLVDFTYKLGFHAITAGVWLKDFLKMHHGLRGDSFDLACDHDIYNAKNRIEPSQKTVIFYARDNTARRCVELGMLALAKLKQEMPEIHIILFGFDKKSMNLPFIAEVYGIIPPERIAALYARSSVGLSLSATNHSLIPNEMMACGLPVVELNLPNNTMIYPQNTVTYADPHPNMIFATLQKLLTDNMLRTNLSRNSIKYANKLSWDKSAKIVEEIICRRFNS